MPYSDSRFDDKVLSIIKELKPKSVLDIGPGAGKYGRLVRSVNDKTLIDSVEVDSQYVKEFKLRDIYDHVFVTSIQKFIEDQYDTNYDLVILGDVIEHLKKSEGIDLINFYVYRSKHIIVQWPHGYIQNTWEGHKHENHISVWGRQDFANFKFKLLKMGFMRLAIIKGYL